jgi:hypothetical protein
MKLKILVENELLFDLGNGKFETAFPIISADAQRQIDHVNLKAKNEYYKLIREILDDFFSKHKDAKLFGAPQTQSFEELKWMYIFLFANGLSGKAKREKNLEEMPFEEKYTKRQHGHWDMMALEDYDSSEKYPQWIGHNGSSVGVEGYAISIAPATFCFYELNQCIRGQEDKGRWFNNQQAELVWDMYNGVAEYETNKEMIDWFLDIGVFEAKDGKYIPKFILAYTYPGNGDPIVEDYLATLNDSLWNKVKSLHTQVSAETITIISKEVPEKLHNQILKDFFANANLSVYAMFAAVEDGYLEVPDDFQKSMIGAFMMVNQRS